MTKPSVLQRHLSDTLKLNEDKCDAFVNVWINSAKGIVEHLRKRSLFPAQVSKMLEIKLFYTVAANCLNRTAVLLKTEILLVSGYLLSVMVVARKGAIGFLCKTANAGNYCYLLHLISSGGREKSRKTLYILP